MGDYELYHASTRKHKYIKKIGKRYFYTQQELAAYLKDKTKDVHFEKHEWDDEYAGPIKAYKLNLDSQHYGLNRGVGVAVGKRSISVFNDFNNRSGEKNNGVPIVEQRGRLRSRYVEDQSMHTLDFSDKKTHQRRKKADADYAKKYNDDYYDIGAANKRKRKKAAKSAKKQVNKALSSLKKQSARGKRALDRWKKKGEPKVTVVQSISEDKNYKRQNGQRG